MYMYFFPIQYCSGAPYVSELCDQLSGFPFSPHASRLGMENFHFYAGL